MQETEKIWMNGELVDWADARSTSACTACTTAPASSRASAAMRPSAVRPSSGSWTTSSGSTTSRALLYMELPYSAEELAPPASRPSPSTASRPRTFGRSRSTATASSASTRGEPGGRRDHVLAVGRLPRRDEPANGVRAMISSWRRVGPNTIPHAAKATGVYLNSMLATHEARRAGYDEAILLTEDGYVADGPGEKIFVVKDGGS